MPPAAPVVAPPVVAPPVAPAPTVAAPKRRHAVEASQAAFSSAAEATGPACDPTSSDGGAIACEWDGGTY